MEWLEDRIVAFFKWLQNRAESKRLEKDKNNGDA